MKHYLILYIGEKTEKNELIEWLQDWCMEQHEIDFRVESIHHNPAKAVQLRLTQLPALVLNNRVIVQGNSIAESSHALGQLLSAKLDTEQQF